MVNIEEISKEVALELGLNANLVERVARLPWKFTKDHLISRDTRPIIHIHLGKFHMKPFKLKALEDPEFVELIRLKDEERDARYI